MFDHKSLVMKLQNNEDTEPTPTPPLDLAQILKVVSFDIEQLESQILRDVRTEIPLLNNVTEHILSSGGKRLRPALVFLGAKMFGGVDQRVMQAAQVIEYLHTATLLHDDVVDAAETRRNKQTEIGRASCRERV